MRMLAGLGCRSFNFFVLASRYMNKIWVFKRKQRSRERVKRHYYYFSYLLLPNKNSFCVRINKNITRCCWSRARARILSLSIIMRAENKGILSTSNTAPAARAPSFWMKWGQARMREVPSFCQKGIQRQLSRAPQVFVQSGTKVRIKICKTQLN